MGNLATGASMLNSNRVDVDDVLKFYPVSVTSNEPLTSTTCQFR